MEFTFECIVLKNNQLVRESITLPLTEAEKDLQLLSLFFHNSIEWFNTIEKNGILQILKNKPINDSFCWKDIYPNFISETKDIATSKYAEHLKICSYIQDANPYNKHETLKEKVKDIKSVKSFTDEEWEFINEDHYKTIKYRLLKNLTIVETLIRNNLRAFLERKSEKVFLNHDYSGFWSDSYTTNDFKFQWSTNYGFGLYSYDCVSISYKNKSKIRISTNENNFELDINYQRFQSPFSDNTTIGIINNCINNKEFFLKDFIKEQILTLKDAFKAEERFLNILTTEKVPELESIHILITKQIDQFEDKDSEEFTKLSIELEKLNKEIKIYTNDNEYCNDFETTVRSIKRKKTRLDLLKIECKWWQDLYKSGDDFLDEIK